MGAIATFVKQSVSDEAMSHSFCVVDRLLRHGAFGDHSRNDGNF
jgi:hypothetical protein